MSPRSVLLTVFSIVSPAALTWPAFPAELPNLSGTWSLAPSQSQDPNEVLGDAAEAKSQGAGQSVKRVLRGINIFGVPVGSLPLPEREKEPDDDEADYLDRLLTATELEILQESSATDIDYKPGATATYPHGVEVETDVAKIVANWRNDVFEISHDLWNGTKITETYVVEPTGSLRWTVEIERKRAKPIAIMRVFTRKPENALRFAAS